MDFLIAIMILVAVVAFCNLIMAVIGYRRQKPISRLHAATVTLGSCLTIWTLAALAALVSKARRELAQEAHARQDIQILTQAIGHYHTMYGRWPTVHGLGGDVTVDVSTPEMSGILAGSRSTENPDGFTFIHVNEQDAKKPRLDPWNGHYFLTIDGNADGFFDLKLPSRPRSFIVWSGSQILLGRDPDATGSTHSMQVQPKD